MAYMAPIYAAIAAAEKKKQEEEEEALMTEFMRQDKSGDWEYKIIRGTLGAFRNEGRMQRALEAESHASWELAMKLDDERLVLRRPKSASKHDMTLGPDARPYRTDYGAKTVLIIVGVLLLLLGVSFFAYTLFSGTAGATGGYSIIMMGVIGILVVLGLLVVVMKFRR
jgi:amino acid transporter